MDLRTTNKFTNKLPLVWGILVLGGLLQAVLLAQARGYDLYLLLGAVWGILCAINPPYREQRYNVDKSQLN